MIGSCIPVRMTMVPGVLSTNMNNILIQLHNQLPYNRTNNVTRYHIQNRSSWPTRFSVMNCRQLTVLSLAQCHVCQHWHKSLPQPSFPFSEQSLQKFQQELKNPQVGNSHQLTLVLRSREALHSSLELSSLGYLFSRDSPVVDKSFTEISLSQVAGSMTQHGAEVFPRPRNFTVVSVSGNGLVRWCYLGLRHHLQHPTASTGPSSMRSLSPCATTGTGTLWYCSIWGIVTIRWARN